MSAPSSDLARSGYDEAWFAAKGPVVAQTVRNLYVRLRPLGLWDFVTAEWETERGNVNFRCADVAGLKARLPGLAFTRPAATRTGFWQAIEKRASASLHFKHFEGWDEDCVQVHIDPVGSLLSPWWWLFPPGPLILLARHKLNEHGYLEVERIRELLIHQGYDPS